MSLGNACVYEMVKDMVYAGKNRDPSFEQRMLHAAREYFNEKAIELEEAPTMKKSNYEYFNHCSSSEDE